MTVGIYFCLCFPFLIHLIRQRKNVPGLQIGQLFDNETAAHADEPATSNTQGENEIVTNLSGDHYRLPHLLDTLLRNDDYLLVLESR